MNTQKTQSANSTAASSGSASRAVAIINDILTNHLPRVIEGLKAGYVDENQILVIYDHAVRARILKEHAEQQKDSERLNWLEKTKTSIGYNVENCAWGVDYEAPYGKTIREGIDAAMTPSGSAPFRSDVTGSEHLMGYVLKLHIITDPNGICMCGEGGLTCLQRLAGVSNEIQSCMVGAKMAEDMMQNDTLCDPAHGDAGKLKTL